MKECHLIKREDLKIFHIQEDTIGGQIVIGMIKNNKLEIIRKRWIILLLIVLSLFISGCPHKNDGYYPLAEEVYMMGWILRNINDSTPTVLEYKPEELSKYNYSYGFPGDLPSYYRNTNAWVAPFEWGVITSFVDFSAPSNRIHYLRADNALELSYGRDWSFSNMMYINLKNSDDEIERNFYNNEHKEHYKSENVFYGINPVPGEDC
jgi:hypothetical protein